MPQLLSAQRAGVGGRARSCRNFSNFSQIFLKYQNLDITLSEIIEILRNSGENPLKFDEKHAKSAASFENQQKICEILQKMCKGLKNPRNLEWCKGKNVELEKC